MSARGDKNDLSRIYSGSGVEGRIAGHGIEGELHLEAGLLERETEGPAKPKGVVEPAGEDASALVLDGGLHPDSGVNVIGRNASLLCGVARVEHGQLEPLRCCQQEC